MKKKKKMSAGLVEAWFLVETHTSSDYLKSNSGLDISQNNK